MAKPDTIQFKGLPADFFAFFEELIANNERAWFATNKARYQQSVVAPMTYLVADMAPRLARISKHYIADPKRALFRIHRDVRFAKDKSPYKTHAAAQFRHEVGRDVHAPGFYVHAGPDEIYVGAGIWMPPAPQLKSVRDRIAKDTAAWRRIVTAKPFVGVFGGLSDDPAYTLKRPPKGYDPGHPAIEDLKRTSFVFGHTVAQARARKAGFIDEVEEAYRAAAPAMRFLCTALGLPF